MKTAFSAKNNIPEEIAPHENQAKGMQQPPSSLQERQPNKIIFPTNQYDRPTHQRQPKKLNTGYISRAGPT